MAQSTLKLSTEVKAGFRTEVSCSKPFVIDQPRPMSGHEGPNPLEVFLSSLGACLCAIGRILASQERITLRGIRADVEGDLDKDFLMGATTEGRAGFTEIRVRVEVDADLTPAEKAAFVARVEARCPIADNLARGTVVHTQVV